MKIKLKVLLILTLSCVSCITVRTPSVNDAVLPTTEVCVNLTFKSAEAGPNLGGRDAYPIGHAMVLKSNLKFLKVNTECSGPSRNITLFIEEENSFGILSTTWVVASLLTLGIIPFHHNENIRVDVIENDKIIRSEHYTSEKRFAIYYLFRMLRENWETQEKVPAFSKGDAEFAYFLSTLIRNSIEQRPN